MESEEGLLLCRQNYLFSTSVFQASSWAVTEGTLLNGVELMDSATKFRPLLDQCVACQLPFSLWLDHVLLVESSLLLRFALAYDLQLIKLKQHGRRFRSLNDLGSFSSELEVQANYIQIVAKQKSSCLI